MGGGFPVRQSRASIFRLSGLFGSSGPFCSGLAGSWWRLYVGGGLINLMVPFSF
jgi:hypothetical protein